MIRPYQCTSPRPTCRPETATHCPQCSHALYRGEARGVKRSPNALPRDYYWLHSPILGPEFHSLRTGRDVRVPCGALWLAFDEWHRAEFGKADGK